MKEESLEKRFNVLEKKFYSLLNALVEETDLLHKAILELYKCNKTKKTKKKKR